MELSFAQLKKLQVISLTDGKNLGRVCDISFIYPENCIKGFVVTGGRGFKFIREEQFIEWDKITKIGEDVILVRSEKKPRPCPPPPRRSMDDYE